MKLLSKLFQFQWDDGNSNKNWLKHHVTQEEAEQIFFDSCKIVAKDTPHSHHEERYLVLGSTKADRLLTIAFTIRHDQIRVISARNMSRKEREIYQVVNRRANEKAA